MAVITQEIKVEVAKKNLFQALVSKQSDYNSRFLKVTLCDNGVPIKIDPASTVTINANRPDGTCKRFAGVSNDDDTVTVPLAAWMLELAGMVYCDISVTKPDDSKLTSTSFSIDVEPAAASDEAISENEEYDVLVQLVERVEDAAERAEDAAQRAEAASPDGPNPQFGATVKIVGGEKETDVGRVEVGRDFETYGAINRKFAAYDYNGFLAKDKKVNGKPLYVCTNVWPLLQLNAYSNNNVATDDIVNDYNANQDKYYDDKDCLRRDINIHFPMKDGQVAIIENGGILSVHNVESDNVNTGVSKTGWVIFENDDAKNGSPNRMFNEYWDLYKLGHISAPIADAAFKNVRTQAVYAPWLIFDNDGGTADTYNRLYSTWWKLNNVKTIEAPIADAKLKSVDADNMYAGYLTFDLDEGAQGRRSMMNGADWIMQMLERFDAPSADASFKSVKVSGEDVALAKDVEALQKEIADLKATLASLTENK